MARRYRIQARPRWADDEQQRSPWPSPPPPLSLTVKLLAAAGIVQFWLYFFGWIGPGGKPGLEQGFWLFLLAQFPLAWRWMRGQMGRWG